MISLRIVDPERADLILGSSKAISRTISDVDPAGTVIFIQAIEVVYVPILNDVICQGINLCSIGIDIGT